MNYENKMLLLRREYGSKTALKLANIKAVTWRGWVAGGHILATRPGRGRSAIIRGDDIFRLVVMGLVLGLGADISIIEGSFRSSVNTYLDQQLTDEPIPCPMLVYGGYDWLLQPVDCSSYMPAGILISLDMVMSSVLRELDAVKA